MLTDRSDVQGGIRPAVGSEQPALRLVPVVLAVVEAASLYAQLEKMYAGPSREG